jgi:anaerobic selenocysteine-containing dehydrogenase
MSILGITEPVMAPMYDTRHPADVLLELARRVGPEVSAALPWTDFPAYLKYRLEGLAASGQGSVISGSFEESWVRFLEERGWRFLGKQAIDSLWGNLLRESAWTNPVRLRGDWERLLPTASGRFEFFSRELESRLREIGAESAGTDSQGADLLAHGIDRLGLAARGDEACMPHYEPEREIGSGELTLLPFRPITARGDLGVTSPMVLEMFGYPTFSAWQTWAELAPATAHELELEDGDEVAVESDIGSLEAVVRIQHGATPGTVHLPTGLGHRDSLGVAGGVGSNPHEIMLPAADPLSGKASVTSTLVRLRLLRRRRHGAAPTVHGGREA